MEEEREIGLGIDIYEQYITLKVDDAFYLIKSVKSHCENCDKVGFMLKCSNCYSIYYCSKECQKLHYKEHKSFCKLHNNDDNKEYKKIIYFRKTLSLLFYTNFLQKPSLCIPKKMKKYRFWNIFYKPQNEEFIFKVMPYDLINDLHNDIKKKKPIIKKLFQLWCCL